MDDLALPSEAELLLRAGVLTGWAGSASQAETRKSSQRFMHITQLRSALLLRVSA